MTQKVVHNPELLGPHTETLGLVAPGDWIDFFRYVGEQYQGLIVPEHDDRDLKSLLIPKVMAAKDRFDVHFERNYAPPEVADWQDSENVLPAPLEPYFLRANTGPRYILGGVLSRPFINASQCGGKFSITSIESSKLYEDSPLARWLTFPTVDHCFCVQEGVLRVKLRESGAWTEVREGQTLLVSAGQAFTLGYGSRFVRAIVFTNGPGIEALIQNAGQPLSSFVLPEESVAWEEDKVKRASEALGVVTEAL